MTLAYFAVGLLAVCLAACALYAIDWVLGLWLDATEDADEMRVRDALGRWQP